MAVPVKHAASNEICILAPLPFHTQHKGLAQYSSGASEEALLCMRLVVTTVLIAVLIAISISVAAQQNVQM